MRIFLRIMTQRMMFIITMMMMMGLWNDSFASAFSILPWNPTTTTITASSSSLFMSMNANSNAEEVLSEKRNGTTTAAAAAAADERNDRYVQGLLENLTSLLDKYVLTGSPQIKTSIENVYVQIRNYAKRNPEAIEMAKRNIRSAGIHIPKDENDDENNTWNRQQQRQEQNRLKQATERKQWEESFRQTAAQDISTRNTTDTNTQPSTSTIPIEKHRSALGTRGGPTNDNNNNKPNFLSIQKNIAKQRVVDNPDPMLVRPESEQPPQPTAAAAEQVAEWVARSAPIFSGEAMGIGGLEDVVNTLKRRVWIPLAAPPQLLHELGIVPVRGVLLYGRPGCGKTLLAQKLGTLLSPLRPITVVSGPEIMDKYVGSSEMKLREIFDTPPEIYERYRTLENAPALAKAALHVVIMDEFDAIARHRGGRDGAGDQGDAGVARDSVVNQLLSKMDGVAPLEVPTLVIGLTNKRSLIDAALLRPGRFEVQIEVPPPRTIAQRKSILRVHTRHMQKAGRLLVSDAPEGTAAANHTIDCQNDLPSYDELLQRLAEETDGFSGASLAAMARAAASHALERAVEELTKQNPEESHKLMQECIVTIDDFEESKKDFENTGSEDYSDIPEDAVDLVATE